MVKQDFGLVINLKFYWRSYVHIHKEIAMVEAHIEVPNVQYKQRYRELIHAMTLDFVNFSLSIMNYDT